MANNNNNDVATFAYTNESDGVALTEQEMLDSMIGDGPLYSANDSFPAVTLPEDTQENATEA